MCTLATVPTLLWKCFLSIKLSQYAGYWICCNIIVINCLVPHIDTIYITKLLFTIAVIDRLYETGLTLLYQCEVAYLDDITMVYDFLRQVFQY